MKQKRLAALFLALVMVLGVLSGCGGGNNSNDSNTSNPSNASQPSTSSTNDTQSGSGPVEITLWHLFGEADTPGHPHVYYTQWAENFNATHDNIHVTVLGGKSATDIQTAIAAGSTPDIFMNYWNNAPQWADAGALLDLTSYYESDANFDYKDIMPGALALSYYDGHFYSVPNSYSTTFMFYRADILAECGWNNFPTNTDELMQCIKDTTEANPDGSIKRLGLLPNMPWLDTEMWSAAFDTSWLADDGVTVTANSDANVAWLQFILDIYAYYESEYGWDALAINDFGDTVRGNRATANDPVLTGEVAMRWNAEGLQANLAEQGAGIDWQIAWFPNAPGAGNAALLTSNVWEINSKTEHPDEAWEALADLTGKDNQKIMAQGEYGNGGFYARKSTLEYIHDTLADELGAAKEDATVGAKITDNLKVISNAMLTGNLRAFPCIGYINEYLNSIESNADLVFTEGLSPAEAMQNVVDEIQPLATAHPFVGYNG